MGLVPWSVAIVAVVLPVAPAGHHGTTMPSGRNHFCHFFKTSAYAEASFCQFLDSGGEKLLWAETVRNCLGDFFPDCTVLLIWYDEF